MAVMGRVPRYGCVMVLSPFPLYCCEGVTVIVLIIPHGRGVFTLSQGEASGE